MAESYEVSDSELLRRVVRDARDSRKRKGERHPRWVAVMDVFIVGSTYAHLICQRFGHNPDEMVKR